jgi:hypothetical protein
MYIDERLLKILDTHKGETIDVNFMISLIKTIAKEHETEQLLIGSVVESALTPEDLTIFAKWVDDHFYTHRLKILPRELENFYIENRESIVKQYS